MISCASSFPMLSAASRKNESGGIYHGKEIFDHQYHVETVVCLSNKKSKDYVEIGVDAEDYYRIKG